MNIQDPLDMGNNLGMSLKSHENFVATELSFKIALQHMDILKAWGSSNKKDETKSPWFLATSKGADLSFLWPKGMLSKGTAKPSDIPYERAANALQHLSQLTNAESGTNNLNASSSNGNLQIRESGGKVRGSDGWAKGWSEAIARAAPYILYSRFANRSALSASRGRIATRIKATTFRNATGSPFLCCRCRQGC